MKRPWRPEGRAKSIVGSSGSQDENHETIKIEYRDRASRYVHNAIPTSTYTDVTKTTSQLPQGLHRILAELKRSCNVLRQWY